MADEKKYTVTTPDYETTVAVWFELTADEALSEKVPPRPVEVANARRGNPRNTEYWLTDEEAEELRQDSRVQAVEQVDIIPMSRNAFQSGTFSKAPVAANDQDQLNWGLIRHVQATNTFSTGVEPSGTPTYDYVLDGTGVDVVVIDSGIKPDHPDFLAENTTEYVSTAVATDNTNGAVFDRSLTVHGLKIVVAGAVGGQLAVPTVWAEKVGKVVQLLTNPTDAKINLTHQKRLIATLKGDSGTYRAGYPAAQRVAYGGGDSYDPNFLSDAGAQQYAGYVDFLDSHGVNDMVWYKNTSGPDPSTSDRDIEEIIEHLFHTIHNFGVQGAVPGSENEVVMDPDRKVELDNSFDWTQTEIHLAMKEAITAGKFDPSGYSTTYDTDPGAAAVAYKEYTYLLNWGMWDMSQFWEGGSLSPEWSDDMRTPAGIASNNPLGHALFVKYFQPVLSKPNFTTLQSIFQDNDAGASQYTPSLLGYCRVQEIDWYAESGVSGTLPTGFYTDFDGHGTQCASVMAGKRMGWAKNADIYSIKLASLEGGSDPNNGISAADTFDVLIGWHNAKTNGRPTIINNSWSYVIFWDTVAGDLSFDQTFAGTTYAISGGSYRGTPWSGSTYDTAKGHVGSDLGGNVKVFPYRVASVDADVNTLVTAGVIVVNAAGNDSQKVDLAAGNDYNNYVSSSGLADYYYHRGGSPYVEYPNGFEVPALDSSAAGGENVASFSNRGPATPVYAAGEDITAAGISGFEFFGESGYTYSSVSGTSFSAPQIAGMAALLMQVHPDWTPQQVAKWFVDKSVKNILQTTGLDNDYTSFITLLGGQNSLAFFPMSGQRPFSIIGS